MLLINHIKMFVLLFFYSNKNFFFEKYKFLRFSEKNKNTIFIFIYIIKKIFFIISLSLLKSLFGYKVLILSILFMLVLYIFKIDNNDLRLFFRKDFSLTFPISKNRFLIILIGESIIKLIISGDIIIFFIFFIMNTKFSIFYSLIIFIAYVLIYMSTIAIHFVIQNSNIIVKKAFSFINYLSSFCFSIFFSYYFINFVLSIFKLFKNNLKSGSVMNVFFEKLFDLIDVSIQIVISNTKIIMTISFIYIVFVYFLCLITFRYLNSCSVINYNKGNFIFLNLIKNIVSVVFRNNILLKTLIGREVELFKYIYNYNFKDYFFIFISDRAIAFLISIFFVILKYRYEYSYLIIFLVSIIVLFVDISSSVGVKLIVNMSFVADYKTLLLSNSNGFDIRKLIKSKIYFFYSIKLFSYIIMFVIFNIAYFYLKMPMGLIVLSNIINLFILFTFPKLYFVNNIIYTRLNYSDYDNYLNESKILETGVSEFLPFNVLFRLLILITVFSIIFTTVISPFSVKILIYIDIIIVIFSIVVTSFIMNRIFRNILSFIDRGDYSADFSKIFKK